MRCAWNQTPKAGGNFSWGKKKTKQKQNYKALLLIYHYRCSTKVHFYQTSSNYGGNITEAF